MINKTIVFTPWCGEFGWELFKAQSFMRELSKNYKSCVCSSLKQNEILYSDFCDVFEPFEHSRLHSNMYLNQLNDSNILINSTEYKNFINKYSNKEKYEIYFTGRDFIGKQQFKEYGNYNKNLVYDVVLHMRNRQTYGTDRNWSIENWKKLVVLLLQDNKKIACIGGSQDFIFDGVDDFRICGLKNEADLLQSSKLVVGTISGGIHFASLCNCDSLTWGKDTTHYRFRMEKDWNPFNLNNIFIGEQTPTVDTIYNKIKQMI